MTRGRWFRKYDSTMDDPKVQMLSDWHYRAWDTLLCFASKHGGEFTDSLSVLAFVLRKPEGKVRETMQVLLSASLMEKTEGGYKPHNWDLFQYKSDTSNDRVAAYRERKAVTCNVTVTDNVTPPDTEADTDQKQKVKTPARKRASVHPRFEDFWSVCPLKVDRGAAEKLFSKACDSGTDPEILIASMRAYGRSQQGTEKQYIAHPRTWLFQRRWEDEGAAGAVVIRPSAFNSPEEQENQRKALERMNARQTQN